MGVRERARESIRAERERWCGVVRGRKSLRGKVAWLIHLLAWESAIDEPSPDIPFLIPVN